ncbi:hypothetical protein RUM44_002960 [Polyplax serrata]|uniref:Uncharacterized protein n=1 Tax=Polyplax serrata TaxID=468196 RepID=A0ABR1AX62_POLSC
MKRDFEKYFARDRASRNHEGGFVASKMNSLLSNLIEKEEELIVYKRRLKELEKAFHYNLEVISERDLELSTLEKELSNGHGQLQKVLRERNEMQDLLKALTKRNDKKIQQLETKLSNKERELRTLQKENLRNANTLKKLSHDFKEDDWKKILQMNSRFETDRKELLDVLRQEMEEKERYYLLEIDNLSEKLEEIKREKHKFKRIEEENISLKCHLTDMEKLFKQKETAYLEQLEKFRTRTTVVSREVQCGINKKRVADKQLQASPTTDETGIQSVEPGNENEEYLRKKFIFVQQQNEVLKCVIKDLKKNNDFNTRADICDECVATKLEIRAVNEKFESEISSIKKALVDEKMQRTEEEAVIQNMEATMTCLKDRLLSGLSNCAGKFEVGDDIFNYSYNQVKLQVSDLERRLCDKMDTLISDTRSERNKMNETLKKLENECLEKLDKALLREDSTAMLGENLLEKIRVEIVKLENKIENDMKDMVTNNNKWCSSNKAGLNNLQMEKALLLTPQNNSNPVPEMRICKGEESSEIFYASTPYGRKDNIWKEKSTLGCGKLAFTFENQFLNRRFWDGNMLTKFSNDFMIGR